MSEPATVDRVTNLVIIAAAVGITFVIGLVMTGARPLTERA